MRSEMTRRLSWRYAIALLLLCAAPVACAPKAPPQDAGKSIASTFLKEIQEGRVDAAWSATTAEFKSMLGLEGLRAYVKKNKTLSRPSEFVSLTPVDRNGLAMAECLFRPADAGSNVKVLLARENGEWKVERLSVE